MDNDKQEKPQMIRVYPKPNCPRCYGRGWVGEIDGGRLDCSCLMRAKAHIDPAQKRMER